MSTRYAVPRKKKKKKKTRKEIAGVIYLPDADALVTVVVTCFKARKVAGCVRRNHVVAMATGAHCSRTRALFPPPTKRKRKLGEFCGGEKKKLGARRRMVWQTVTLALSAAGATNKTIIILTAADTKCADAMVVRVGR